MKKYFKSLFVLAFLLIIFAPLLVFADEKAYEYVDFKVEIVDGEKINDTKVKIYASLEGDEDNLYDRTEEFNIEEIMWSVCVEEDCATSEQVLEDAIFESEKAYVFLIRITAKNGADIDVWGTDRAMLNGTPIEQLDGEYSNSGKELMIKSKTALQRKVIYGDEEDEESQEEYITVGEEKTCPLGLSICCVTFLGLSLCIWILILIVLIILIIIFRLAKKKKQ